MDKSKVYTALGIVITLFFVLPVYTVNAAALEQSLSDPNYDIIILTPGHSRTIFYELHNTVSNDVTAIQATLILTAGAGTLSIGVANSSFIGEGSELIYVTSGFMGTTPILDYAYSSAPISTSVEVGEVSVGLLITGVLVSVGNPDFPVTMSMTFSLF